MPTKTRWGRLRHHFRLIRVKYAPRSKCPVSRRQATRKEPRSYKPRKIVSAALKALFIALIERLPRALNLEGTGVLEPDEPG